MKVTDFDYVLPEQLIAQTPVEKRDHSRLMVVDRISGTIKHDYFYNILNYLDPTDLMVFNDTKVIPARLYGKKDTGGVVEILLLGRHLGLPLQHIWNFIGKNIGIAKKILFENGLTGEIAGNLIVFNDNPLQYGHIPLPPYISQNDDFKERYQTVYAINGMSAAAPTAGLHFTPEIMNKIINKAFVTLNVGLGTFKPLKDEIVEENVLHEETYWIAESSVSSIRYSKERGNKIVAVGTTSVRVLESIPHPSSLLTLGEGISGETNIFIYPGYEFKLVDKLITNFHLPKSSLLMLVCAFGGKDLIMRAYTEAVKEKYRFFSFGDAMLIL